MKKLSLLSAKLVIAVVNILYSIDEILYEAETILAALLVSDSRIEVLSNSVEIEQAAVLSDDDYPLQVNSSNNALASCKSLVSNPSVNQL